MEQVLKSQELQSANKKRATIKSSVTKVANKLKASLSLDSGQKYDFTKINKRVIQDDYEKLKGNYCTLDKSHDSFVEKCLEAACEAGISQTEIDDFQSDQDQDFEKYRTVALEVLGLYEFEYKTALDQYLLNIKEETKFMPAVQQQTEIQVNAAKQKSKSEAKKMLSRWICIKEQWTALVGNINKNTEGTQDLSVEQLNEKTFLFDAENDLKEVESEWKMLFDFHNELLDQLEAAEYDEKSIKESLEFDLLAQIRVKSGLVNTLKRFVQYQKIKKTTTESKVEAAVISGEKTGIKLKGLSAPQFSGKAEDFASWKERFLALVPKGRSKEEIAALLELSIPSKKVYLLRECSQDDYEGMLDVLQRELAPTRDVINNVKLQLAKMKKIVAEDKDGDRKFITMVEDLEKISRDLKAINELSVLANSSTLDEIERKLPPVVLTWWRQDKHSIDFYSETDV